MTEKFPPDVRRAVDMRLLGQLGVAAELTLAPFKENPPVPYGYALSQFVIAVILDIAAEVVLPPEQYHPDLAQEVMNALFLPTAKRRGPTPYLRPGYTSNEEATLHSGRIIDLAELLYNLQTVPGICDIYARLITDPDQFEATILELEGLRLLWFSRLPFRIRHSGSEENLHYECEIYPPNGHIVYCEMKCKPEGTKFSRSSVKRTLDHARKHQLPKGKCGVIFLKIPIDWITDGDSYSGLKSVIESFFRSTTRVSEVMCYSKTLVWAEDSPVAYVPMVINEFLNDHSPYTAQLDGGLLKGRLEQKGNPRWFPFAFMTPNLLRSVLEAEGVEVPDSLGRFTDFDSVAAPDELS